MDTADNQGCAPASEPAPVLELEEDDRSRTFAFEHKLFAVEGGYFAPVKDTLEPAFHLPLGDLKGAVTLPTLRVEFGIAKESRDGQLLDIVERGLRYVKEIRPNDSIPHELLDGTASWSVEERHKVIARHRLTMQLVSWMTGGESVIHDMLKLEQLADDPQTKQRVQEAFRRAAEKLGYGPERKQEVVDMIDVLARELSYIEALRDRYARIQYINTQLNFLSNLYKRDTSIRNEIFRMQALIRTPIANFDTMFNQCDAQTGEILAVLRNIAAQTKFIRDMRDELHHRMMLWDELIAKWDAITVDRSIEIEALLKETYRFLARNFALKSDWPLTTRPGGR
jgi:hypothetical protein